MSTTEGFHTPAIPLPERLGKTGTLPLAQIVSDVPKLKVGVVLGITVTFMEEVVPHWPEVGVKV